MSQWRWVPGRPIGPDVEIGEGTKVESHVVIKGPTRIGARNHIYQFSTIGEATPDLKYRDEPTELHIGDDNVIRENVTIHRGTVQDRSLTEVGHRNLIMAYAHIGHDSVVGNDTILVNNTALAGHVEVGDWAILSGYTLVHQFCKIGTHSFSGMGTSIGKDVPAFVTVAGVPPRPKRLMRRDCGGVGSTARKSPSYAALSRFFIDRGLTLDAALERLQSMVEETPSVQTLIDSLEQSQRGIVR